MEYVVGRAGADMTAGLNFFFTRYVMNIALGGGITRWYLYSFLIVKHAFVTVVLS